MQVIKRMSELFKGLPRQPPLAKKESNYRPATRVEKIRDKEFVYPSSTTHRFIFKANLDGSGFQRNIFPSCPPDIPLSQMLSELNWACYKQWERNRAHYQKHPFEKLNCISTFSLIIALLLVFVLQVLVSDGDLEGLTNYIFIFFCFLATTVVICLVAYLSKLPEEDTDALMVSCIQHKLKEFNDRQMEQSKMKSRFMWTSHKQCLWIAFRI